MTKPSIVLLLGRNPSERDFARFQIQRLAISARVTILDFSLLLHRPALLEGPGTTLKGVSIFAPTSLAELAVILPPDNAPVVAVDLLPEGRIRRKIRSVLRPLGTKIVIHPVGPIPTLDHPSLLMSFRSRLPRSIEEVARVPANFADKAFPSQEQADFFIASGEASRYSRECRSARIIVEGRSLDCEEFDRSSLYLPGKQFGLLLDSGGPLHPDYSLLGIRPSISPDKYFSQILHLLKDLEEKTGTKILLAPHPRVPMKVYRQWLPETPCIEGSTASAVKSSAFVLDFGSTATSFSVLAQKPVTYLSFGLNYHSLEERIIRAFSSALKRPVARVDSPIPPSLVLHPPDPDAYDSYTKNYLFSDDWTGRNFAEELLEIASNHPR